MKSLILLSFLFIAPIQQNPGINSDNEIRTLVNEFVQAMHKPVDFKTMQALYLDFPFMSVVRVGAHEIKTIKEDGNAVMVEVHSYWNKSNGEKIINDFALKLKKTEGAWKIVNSKNLSNIKGFYPYAYEYAIANGMLKKSDDLWDMELHAIIKKAKKELGD